jgi:hypothetical protein
MIGQLWQTEPLVVALVILAMFLFALVLRGRNQP